MKFYANAILIKIRAPTKSMLTPGKWHRWPLTQPKKQREYLRFNHLQLFLKIQELERYQRTGKKQVWYWSSIKVRRERVQSYHAASLTSAIKQRTKRKPETTQRDVRMWATGKLKPKQYAAVAGFLLLRKLSWHVKLLEKWHHFVFLSDDLRVRLITKSTAKKQLSNFHVPMIPR